ncbi:MAG: hypothetical protein L0Y66_23425 [Myxococcaceae bacterium]|nr:hypothetical protein [Myxococcaceae bacterium]MCI0672196.1 hypothetical protein [Myxococcaceae bacterium]
MSTAQPEYGVDESRLIRGEHGVIAEPDDMRVTRAVVVGILSMLIFGVSAVWAYYVMVAEENTILPEGAFPTPAVITQRQYEVGIVNQWQFEEDVRALRLTAERQQSLRSAGWVDRQRQLVHLPIQDAMQQVIQEQQAAQPGGTQPQGGTPQAPGQEQK